MAKNIVLCSDGTGNKGGTGNDSNVYKLYQAIDLHHKTQQISFYDNGVGTKEDSSAVKSTKFWVALSGAFGVGFEKNVRDLYEFLSRHYETGDHIYIFGFSRGASTVRAFTGYIHSCGLLDKSKANSEAEFQKLINKSLEAYEKIESDPQLATNFKTQYAINEIDNAPDANLKIDFIGVWDTVSALGFPSGSWSTSDWFFDGLDCISKKLEQWTNKRWPHQFYNYKLNDSILYACQALAIDDERKTFHPKVWNETERKPSSVEQVWFAGVHSNVGGGYPRSGLSNVALEWIFKKATDKGLVFINDDVSAVKTHANVQDKLYDSREGFGIYYRYQPRDIEQLCISQRTQESKIDAGKIKIHDTVIERVKQETALYAPGFLPSQFEIVSTDSKKKKKLSLDKDKYQVCKEESQKWVDKRQWLYRTFVEVTLVILTSVLLLWAFPPESVEVFLLQESTNLVPAHRYLYELLIYIFPALFKNYITYIVCIQPLVFMLMLSTLGYLMWLRGEYLKNLNKALTKTRLLLLDTF